MCTLWPFFRWHLWATTQYGRGPACASEHAPVLGVPIRVTLSRDFDSEGTFLFRCADGSHSPAQQYARAHARLRDTPFKIDTEKKTVVFAWA